VIPKTIDGLPLHPLIIHATVVLLPVAALAVLLAGVWPAARQYLNVGPLVLSVLALILLPITFVTGLNLKDEVGSTPAIDRHEHLAHQLLIPVIGLVVVAILLELVRRRSSGRHPTAVRGDAGGAGLAVVAGVLAVVFGLATIVQTVRVGEAGARAVWGHSATGAPHSLLQR
jgi:uncharacterized membrane protein YiaA